MRRGDRQSPVAQRDGSNCQQWLAADRKLMFPQRLFAHSIFSDRIQAELVGWGSLHSAERISSSVFVSFESCMGRASFRFPPTKASDAASTCWFELLFPHRRFRPCHRERPFWQSSSQALPESARSVSWTCA